MRDRLTPCDGPADQHLPIGGGEFCERRPQNGAGRHFAWFEAKLPPGPARFVGWLRRPSSRLVRIPLAILLILGGIFSFLPVLGLWMLPLGLLLFAQDVPMLQGPLARMLGWVERNGPSVSAPKALRNAIKRRRCDSKADFAANSVTSSILL